MLVIFALLISNKNLTKSGRVIGWFGWWLSSSEAPRYIWNSVIKATSSIVFTLLSLYPRMATIFSFYWVNTITFVVWKIDRSRDMNNTFLTKIVFLLKKKRFRNTSFFLHWYILHDKFSVWFRMCATHLPLVMIVWNRMTLRVLTLCVGR